MISVLISIKPYWVYLILARVMGWNIPSYKTIEVRKSYPRDPQWDHKVLIYCTKDRKSFQQIPKEHQPAMKRFLGKVVGEFTCDHIEEMEHDVADWLPKHRYDITSQVLESTCLKEEDLWNYGKGSLLYGWCVSNLRIYDRLKDLDELRTGKNIAMPCGYGNYNIYEQQVLRPPQSWMYIKEVQSRRDEWYEPETIVLFNSDHQLGCARAYCPRCGVCLGECSLTDPLNVLDYQRCCPVCGAKIKAEPAK